MTKLIYLPAILFNGICIIATVIFLVFYIVIHLLWPDKKSMFDIVSGDSRKKDK